MRAKSLYPGTASPSGHPRQQDAQTSVFFRFPESEIASEEPFLPRTSTIEPRVAKSTETTARPRLRIAAGRSLPDRGQLDELGSDGYSRGVVKWVLIPPSLFTRRLFLALSVARSELTYTAGGIVCH